MDRITAHNETASSYDQEAGNVYWSAPDFMMGMCYDYIQAGQNLLDIGIGTGISALPFSKHGLNVIGVDGAKSMLKECEKKQVASKLILHDISVGPWPLEKSFHIAISAGVFQFFNNLETIFQEVRKVLLDDGFFCFTVLKCRASDFCKKDGTQDKIGLIDEFHVPMYTHPTGYLKQLADQNDFQIEKDGVIIMEDTVSEKPDDFVFEVYLMKAIGR